MRPWLPLLFWAVLAAQPETPETLLHRIHEQMEQNLSRMPNYTCVQTIQRSAKGPKEKEFRVVDTVRLEVALVAGKEIYSWPGAGRFEDKNLSEMIVGGTTSTGDYAVHAQTLFLTDAPDFTWNSEEELRNRRALRYDFRIEEDKTRYRVRAGRATARVPYHGSIWADRETLELMRLQVIADEIPEELAVRESVTVIDYAKVRVGSSDFLLPQQVDLVLRYASGAEDRNHSVFSGCRQYVGESEISFDAPEQHRPPQETKKPEHVVLPEGLVIESRLKSEVDSRTTMVGDAVVAALPWAVKQNGREIMPKGALLHGRIRRLERMQGGYYLVGFEFFEAEWEGSRAAFFAGLREFGPPQRARARLTPDLPPQKIPGVGLFLIPARGRLRLPQGFRMAWVTQARPAAQP